MQHLNELEEGYLVGFSEVLKQGDRYAVECALNAELSMKRMGMPFSQNVIDHCNAWISEKDFELHAGKGPAPCSER